MAGRGALDPAIGVRVPVPELHAKQAKWPGRPFTRVLKMGSIPSLRTKPTTWGEPAGVGAALTRQIEESDSPIPHRDFKSLDAGASFNGPDTTLIR